MLPEEELLASGDNRQPTLTPMTFARYWATDSFFGNNKFHSCILLLLKMGKRIAHPGVIRMRYVKRCRSLFHWLAGIGFLGTVMEVLLCQPFFLFRGFWNMKKGQGPDFLSARYFTSYFYIRILFTELLLEHFADLTAFLALLFHVLDGLVCGKQCGRTNLRTEITDTLVPGQQLEYIV